MTCVVGLVDGRRVWVGGDSAGVGGYHIRTRTDAKVFTNGPFLMGFTTSFRMGQCLRHKLDTSELSVHLASTDDVERFMVTRFIDAVRDTLKKAGWAKKYGDAEVGGTFIVGCRGRLFTVYDDYQVAEHTDGMTAVGCGDEIALGALYALGKSLPAEERIRKALEAAEYLSTGVRGPFTVLSVDGSV